MKRSHKSRDRSLQFEKLEAREVLAAGITAALEGGVLHVVGTDGDDYIRFERTNRNISILGVDGSWSAKHVKAIAVDLQGGNDFVSTDSQANGGNRVLNKYVVVDPGNGNQQVLHGKASVAFNGEDDSLAVGRKHKNKKNAKVTVPSENLSDHIMVSFRKKVLTITGTNNDDNIAVRNIGNYISIEGLGGYWKAKKVKSIVINLQAGNNEVSLDSLAHGGDQPLGKYVTIHSGSGNHTVHLTDGHDVEFSGSGHTLGVSGGAATLDGTAVTWEEPVPDPAPDPDPTPDPTPEPPATDWFTTTIQDAALRTLGSNLYVDSVIDRSDMMALFQSAEDNGVVDATEFADLSSIICNTSLFGTFDYVWKLSTYVVAGNAANATYQGQALGNLAAGSTSTKLDNLVNKWFLGLDHPVASGTYRQVAGTLFVDGASYTDIRQGSAGDCYLMAALAEVAKVDASAITNMFVINGDGTYTVRYYNGTSAEYVTVDSYLPTNSSGKLIYAGLGLAYNSSSNELWVPLAEKAYVQLNQMGWVRPGQGGSGMNSYSAIDGGYIYLALGHVTGQSTVKFALTSSASSFTTFVSAFNAGKAIGFATYPSPPDSRVVGGHAYAVIGYNATNQTVTLFNPWGSQYQYAELTLSWSQIQPNFQYFDRTA